MPSLKREFAMRHALGMFVADLFKTRAGLKPKNFLLRHQLKIVLRRAMLEEFLRNHADAMAAIDMCV
jgi:hypothetical protein